MTVERFCFFFFSCGEFLLSSFEGGEEFGYGKIGGRAVSRKGRNLLAFRDHEVEGSRVIRFCSCLFVKICSVLLSSNSSRRLR